MNDDDDTHDLTHFDPPLTLDTLRATCPEEFVAAGVSFSAAEEGPWYNDETLPLALDVHDEDYHVNLSLAINDEQWPTYGEVLHELFASYSDFNVNFDELPVDVQRVLLEARAAACNDAVLRAQEAAERAAKVADEVRQQLQALLPSEGLTADLLKVFGS